MKICHIVMMLRIEIDLEIIIPVRLTYCILFMNYPLFATIFGLFIAIK